MSNKPPGLRGFVAVMGLSLLIGAVTGVAFSILEEGGNAFARLGMLAAIVVGLSAILWVCVRWWARLDEAAREAHKWAWYWGGSAGAGFGFIVAAAATRFGQIEGSPVLAGWTPAEAFYNGALALMACQTVGYGLAWAVWWLQRR